MSIDTAAVGGGTPCPRDLGGEDMSAGGRRALNRVASGFTKRDEEGHNGEQVGIESGEGDDEREGHSLGGGDEEKMVVNMNCAITQNSKSTITVLSFSASSISSPHRPRSLHADADASVIDSGSGMEPS